MKKTTLLGTIFALTASLPLSQLSIFSKHTEVYAQEISNENVNVEELCDKFNLHANHELYFPSGGVDEVNLRVLDTLDEILLLDPNNFTARWYRAGIYADLEDISKAKIDYQYIMDNQQFKEAQRFCLDSNSNLNQWRDETGVISGSLFQIVNGEKVPVNNGVAAFFNSRGRHNWNLNLVRDGKFMFNYNSSNDSGIIRPGSVRPLMFFAPGKAPVYKLVTIKENSEVNIGEVILETLLSEGVHVAGFGYVLNHGGREDIRCSLEFLPNRRLRLQENPPVSVITNNEGFYFSRINVDDFRKRERVLGGPSPNKITSENGVLLYNQEESSGGFRD